MGRGSQDNRASAVRRRDLRQPALDNKAARRVTAALEEKGGKLYLVGGAVRDQLLSRPVKDVDLVCGGLSAEKVEKTLAALPGKVDYTGKDFAVFRYREDGDEIELALPRLERSTGASHQDFAVTTDPTITIEDDLLRRDFTFNAIAIAIKDGRIIDPYSGQKDLAARRLKIVSEKSFQEDPLRIIRALVAVSRHDLNPTNETAEAMKKEAKGIGDLPPERIQAELDKLFAGDNPRAAIALAQKQGVLAKILPEVSACYGYEQNNKHHRLDLGSHLEETLANITSISTDPDLRLTALLHDIGKPASAWVDRETGQNHYYQKTLEDGTTVGQDHAALGGQMARETLDRLRYSNERRERISRLIDEHMWSPFTSERGTRRFLARVQGDADDLLALRQADSDGKGNGRRDFSQAKELLAKVRREGQATGYKHLAVSGHDLVAAGLSGVAVGRALDNLLEAVVNEPSLNNKEDLLALLGKAN